MSSTTAFSATPLAAAVRRSWDASRFLGIGIGVALLAYVATFLVVAALLFAAVLIGLPALPEVAKVLRRCAEWERRRAAARLGVPFVPTPYPSLDGGELSERVRRVLTDPTVWRDALWLPLQALAGNALGYLAIVVWPIGLLVDGIGLTAVHLWDRRTADEYGTPPPERTGWVLRWHGVLADLSAGWTRALLTT
ncbi:sensor domain-containing protein, partial [Lentzea sp. NPDC060358]